MQKLNKLLLCLVLFPVTVFSQQFEYSARMNKVEKAGFHAILVTPELSSHLDVTLKDLRIMDARGQQVPYVIRPDLQRLNSDFFQPLPIVENLLRDSSTYLVVENNTGGDLAELHIVLRNTATARNARISGSDDRTNWFIVAENVQIPAGEAVDQDRFRVSLRFPRSSYRFIRIIVFNGKSDPLHIMDAGITSAAASKNFVPLTPNPAASVTQVDSSDGYSYVKLVQPAAYHVAAIRIRLEDAKFYRRRMIVQAGAYPEFEISSINDFFRLPAFKAKEFHLKIFNGDNPPLRVGELITYQEARKVVSYLKENEQYTLLMGSPVAAAPSYDLQTFADSIPPNPVAVSLQAIIAHQAPAARTESGRLTLWLIIGGVLVLLGFFTWNLTREVSKR